MGDDEHSATVPIEILQPLIQLTNELPGVMVPVDWNPDVQEMIHFGLPADQMQQPSGEPSQVMMMPTSLVQQVMMPEQAVQAAGQTPVAEQMQPQLIPSQQQPQKDSSIAIMGIPLNGK